MIARPDPCIRALISNATVSVKRFAAFHAGEHYGQTLRYEPKITCQLRNNGKMSSVIITDNGVGVAPEVQMSMGQPLLRRWEFPAKEPIQKELGGLGLFLATFVAESYDGYLFLASTARNRGASFELGFANYRTT